MVGAMLGNVISGKGGLKKGALAGGAACALFVLLDPYDKERIRSDHEKALNNGSEITDSWQGKDGKTRYLKVSAPQPVQVASHKERMCRRIDSSLQIDGTGSDQGSDIYCRTPEGDWVPA